MSSDWERAGATRLKRANVVKSWPQAELPIPIPNPQSLPLTELSSEAFESLVAEIISRNDNLNVSFYGRSGQRQYGLDVVERERSGAYCLYQVKRYKKITPAGLHKIVEKYAGPPRSVRTQPRRLFDPRRFVVVVSARTEIDTKITDAVDALQNAYAGDLEILVWGSETIGRKLRDAPHLVHAVFGEHWAKEWCGFAPTPSAALAPDPLGLIEGPVEALALDSAERDARHAEDNGEPLTAARQYSAIAQRLDEDHFPGHAVIMRRRQARALETGKDQDAAFAIRYNLAVQQALDSEASVHRPEHYEFAGMKRDLAPGQLSRLALVESVAAWGDCGTDLAVSVPALRLLVDEEDHNAALLACRVIEQTLTDGLFDFVPPRSSVVEVDDDTPELLARLRVLAAEVETPDIVLRARLRCATADAQLTLDASEDDIAKAYNDLIDDASAGRYRHARGLITSRAAYAHAVRGLSSRAIKLWRQSIIASSEHGYYGDVRLAARAARYLARDCGDTEVDKWNVMAIVQALPDQNRLLGERIDPALLAYATAHSDKVVDAFGSARHYLFTTRVGGYLQEHQSALKLFGDVLDEAQEPAEAVWCYVAAGETDKAAKLARSLPTPVDVSAWSQSPLRRRRAAAIQATAAQAQVIPDLDVEPAVEALLENVDGSWRTGLGPTPQVDALKAITSFGARIPESAVDRILKIAGPMIEGDPQQPFELAALLVNTYYAVPSRRGDLSAAIASLLRSPKPPHDLWNLVTQLPAETCGPLLPAVTTMTGEGNRLALRALSRWSPGATASQLQARRACAALLRKPHGPERAVVIGTQEAETVQLLLGLLDLQAPVEFSSDVCVNHEPVIVGLTYITRSTTDDASAEPPAGRTPEEPDETASIAVGPVLDLAIAVADKLMLLAEDRHDAAGSRARVVTALRQLIPRLPSATAASLAPRLFELHENPGLSETDLAEIESDHPLSRARFPLGADRLSPRAVTAAAAAFARSRVQATPVTEDERVFVSRVLAVAAQLLLNDQLAVLGALAIRDIAGSSTTFYHLAFSLLLHGNEGVRTIGVRSAQVSAADLESLVNDPSAAVRAAVAERAGELPSHLHAVLAADTDRHVRRSAQAALADQNGGRQV